jgi:hypothetical protein
MFNRVHMLLTVRQDNQKQRIINLLLLHSSFMNDLGLLNGKMGISIAFFHLFRETGNVVYENYAGELIDEIYEEINVSSSWNFADGLAGIGYGIEYLVSNKFIDADTSVLALPYTFFSVYYQGFKLKMWCPFCLVVQLLLVADFLVLLPVFKVLVFSPVDFLRFTFSFLVPALFWVLYKTMLEKTTWGNQQQLSFLALKRSPKLFRHLLTENRHNHLDVNKDSLLLGNPNAPVTLTAFLSLYCSPCSNAFFKMKALLESCPEIRLNAVFSVYNDEETQKVINTIYYLYSTQGHVAVLHFLGEWYSRAPQLRKELYDGVEIPKEFAIAMQVSEINKKLFDSHKIQGTPTVFVNGFKYPVQYGYDELEYFLNDIITITKTESKRQEAGTVYR